MARSSRANSGYQVELSRQVADELHALKLRAARRGQGVLFTSAFRRIIQALRHNPLVLGEPLYQLSIMGLQVRTIAVAPLVIDFAVDDRRAIVYLKGCKLLSARPS